MTTTTRRGRKSPQPPRMALKAPVVTALRRRILNWYRKHQRKLPWRNVPPARPEPYQVLVSEAMLQQTQVATVIPYFERFIRALPTVQDLALAGEQRVLRLWQGLGYYRRAQNLHAAATAIVERFGGHIPSDPDQLMQLPGVGRYTAGAVASFGFDKAAAVVDGNVARLLSRLFLIRLPINESSARQQLWHLAERLVPQRCPGQFNQALMELGALVCTPRNPKCPLCPVAPVCRARRANQVGSIPLTTARSSLKTVTHWIFALERRGRFLFEQRPSSGLWSNMWQLPTAEDVRGPRTKIAAFAWLQQSAGLRLDPPAQVGQFTHQTTHRSIQFILWFCRARSGRLRSGRRQWRGLGQVDDLPLANPQRRAIRMLEGASRAGPGTRRDTLSVPDPVR